VLKPLDVVQLAGAAGPGRGDSGLRRPQADLQVSAALTADLELARVLRGGHQPTLYVI
jgi:hypothetical protein